MHPIERLRYVARAGGVDLVELVQDAAGALSGFASDPAALVTACRSLLDRHPSAGPVWWLAARVLCAADPGAEAWQAADDLEEDRTAHAVLRHVPQDATVLVVGWPSTVAAGLVRRGDCRLLVVDAGGSFGFRAERLGRFDLDLQRVADGGIGAAAVTADLVLFEAQAMGGDGVVAAIGARAAAAVAADAGVPVWAVAPVGRILPPELWRALAARLEATPAPWEEPDEIVPARLVSAVLRSEGLLDTAAALAAPDCPFAPELLRRLDAPGSW
jgi:hypothetical protein